MARMFSDRRRMATKQGYIKRGEDKRFVAIEHDKPNRVMYRARFDTYQQAKSWMFRRGLWVES